MALGRFGPNRKGILDPSSHDLAHALPASILFLDTSLPANDMRDSLGHPSAAALLASWEKHGVHIAPKRWLREWLALDFFESGPYKGMYEIGRLPLVSAARTLSHS